MILEGVSTDTLYGLELELQRYPGLELESIREEGQVVYEDEAAGEHVVLDLLPQNLLMLLLKGPPTGVPDQPTRVMMPVAPDAIADPILRSYTVDAAAETLLRAVEDETVE